MYHQMITLNVPMEVPEELIDQYMNSLIGEFLTQPLNTHPRPKTPERGFERLIYVNRRTLIGIYRAAKPHYPSPEEAEIFTKAKARQTPKPKTPTPPTKGEAKHGKVQAKV